MEQKTNEFIWSGKIKALSQQAMEECRNRWNSIAKPLHSLGKMEDALIRIAGITGNASVTLSRKALVIMCADNGVVEEGISQTGQEVTAIVANNFRRGNTSVSIMCRKAGADVFPVDIGVAGETEIRNLKIMQGTKNMAKEPAMTREEALRAVETGITIVKELKEEGYHIIATGEMGIGNTTTSSAVASVLLGIPVPEITGRGAGLSDKGLERKQQVIQAAVSLHAPDKDDPLDVLAKVGGLDIAGLAGIFIGGALYQLPVVVDGFISSAAALAAGRLAPEAREYMIASHKSGEPSADKLLDGLGLSPMLTCDMCLGEGTGAVSIFPLLDMAVSIYNEMSTFGDISVEAYEDYSSGKDIK